MTQINNIPEFVIVTVCGGKLKNPEQVFRTVHNGKEIFFCEDSCLASYLADPEGFMSGEDGHHFISEV